VLCVINIMTKFKEIILFDVFNQEIIKFPSRKEAAKILNVDPACLTTIFTGGKRNKCILNRYIRPEDVHLIFTLVDLDTQKEYHCINNYSLFLQINEPYTENYSKYIYALKIQRQNLISIGKYIFHLKDHPPTKFITPNLMSYQSPKLLELHKTQKIQGKIARNLRNRITHALDGVKKIDRTEKLLGCSFPEFMKYIEQLFLPGMTWENHGLYDGTNRVWHMDHIIPCISFDLTKEEEQRKCFHYTNLRPLWAVDNLKRPKK
jgi:hypothetical protein